MIRLEYCVIIVVVACVALGFVYPTTNSAPAQHVLSNRLAVKPGDKLFAITGGATVEVPLPDGTKWVFIP